MEINNIYQKIFINFHLHTPGVLVYPVFLRARSARIALPSHSPPFIASKARSQSSTFTKETNPKPLYNIV